MADKSIVFTKENVPKVMDGSKTHTRRTFSPQPKYIGELPTETSPGEVALYGGNLWECYQYSKNIPDAIRWRMKEPKYRVGDRVGVQESYQITNSYHIPNSDRVRVEGIYLADKEPFVVILTEKESELFNNRKMPFAKTSGRFMYKSLTRTWLGVLGFRYERLQDISEEDILAEGCPNYSGSKEELYLGRYGWFAKLWDSINKKPGHRWADNPYVRVVESKKIIV